MLRSVGGGGASYSKMPSIQQVDMSGRPNGGWQPSSMNMIMKIGVGCFVSMLCVVGFVGAFGLLMPEAGLKQHQGVVDDMGMINWFIDLKSPEEAEKSGHLIYQDKQLDLPRPDFVHHYRKSHSTVDLFADLAQEQLDALSALRSRNITFLIQVIGWRRRASLKRLVRSLEAARYHGFKTRLQFHLDGDAHPLVKEFVEEYEWPHGKTSTNIHTIRLGLESVLHSFSAC